MTFTAETRRRLGEMSRQEMRSVLLSLCAAYDAMSHRPDPEILDILRDWDLAGDDNTADDDDE